MRDCFIYMTNIDTSGLSLSEILIFLGILITISILVTYWENLRLLYRKVRKIGGKYERQ